MSKKENNKREPYVLAHVNRHNPCPICGGEAMMTFPNDHECHAVCPQCQRLNIRFGYADDYADTVQGTCRRPFNILSLLEEHSKSALEALGIHDGEHAVVDDQDGYICCIGNEIVVARYIAEAIERDPDEFYLIYRLFGREFYYVGSSALIEGAIKHILVK
jgi:hypothetical protein